MARRRLILEGAALEAVERLAEASGVSPAKLIKRALRLEDEAQKAEAIFLKEQQDDSKRKDPASQALLAFTQTTEADKERTAAITAVAAASYGAVIAQGAVAGEPTSLEQRPPRPMPSNVQLTITIDGRVLTLFVQSSPVEQSQLPDDVDVQEFISDLHRTLASDLHNFDARYSPNTASGRSYAEVDLIIDRSMLSGALQQLFNYIEQHQGTSQRLTND